MTFEVPSFRVNRRQRQSHAFDDRVTQSNLSCVMNYKTPI